MDFRFQDRDSYLSARQRWRAQYAVLVEAQRSVKQTIRRVQQGISAAQEVFSYDWPAEKQREWLGLYGTYGQFRSVHSAADFTRRRNAAAATKLLQVRASMTAAAQEQYEANLQNTPTPTPS